ncbi:hypothetical protein [Vibrio parahaemolyticus]|uniref:hypothetical protein n=1 Tax=Vibrio parahaemolyticus TaxID=670 RepID=UPI0005F165BE|nr:hypothetical protein [Vibrio parahaemolyticus]KJR15232.1 hypothetical protein UF28_16330 [Vibrio parahaemolyticus]
MLNIISEYKGKPYICGFYDCNLMVLELTGFDISTIQPFNSVLSGMKSLRKATNCKTMNQYLESKGYKKINQNLITDGCFLLQGIHCFVYFDGMVFGVSSLTKTYEWCSLNLQELQEFEVYQWQKQQ